MIGYIVKPECPEIWFNDPIWNKNQRYVSLPYAITIKMLGYVIPEWMQTRPQVMTSLALSRKDYR